MPRVKNYRRRPRRKYNKKNKKYVKHRRNAATTNIVRSPGFADQCYVRLKYAEELKLGDGLSPVLYYSFRGNSLFDPNYTATGHQPLYFDQYAAIYERYRVMGAKITIDIINASGASAAYFVLNANTDFSITTNTATLLEQTKSTISKVIPIAQRIPIRIKMYQSTRKVLGLNKTQIFDQDYGATVSTNPVQAWYFNWLGSSVDATSALNLFFMVRITYYAQFYDRRQMTQS